MTAPTGAMTLLDTELRVILDALDGHQVNDPASQELLWRAKKKIAAELALKERPFVAQKGSAA